jgi:hypothetical protein
MSIANVFIDERRWAVPRGGAAQRRSRERAALIPTINEIDGRHRNI